MKPLLTPKTRNQYKTVLDGRTFSEVDDTKIALVELKRGEEADVYTRAEFQKNVNEYAKGLLHTGVKPGQIVLIALEGLAQTSFCFWGVIKIGATPLVFPTRSPKMLAEVYQENLKYILEELSIDFSITDEPTIGASKKFRSLNAEELLHDLPQGIEIPEYNAKSDEIVHLQTSSGTTGRQKIVPLTHENILNYLATYAEAIKIRETDVMVNWMPLYHDGGLICGLVMPVIYGWPSIMISAFDWVAQPAIMLKAISDYNGSITVMPNFGYSHSTRRIRDKDIEGVSLKSMRLFIFSTERVYKHTIEEFYQRFQQYGLRRESLTVGYGMAEATLIITQTPVNSGIHFDEVDETALQQDGLAITKIDSDESRIIYTSCGKPLRDVSVTILDEDKNPLPDRRVGEVGLECNSLFSGYFLRPDITEKSFISDIYLSGDLGYVADGELFITGRKNDKIITGGRNIYPSDIEEIVFRVEGIRPGRAAVFGVQDEREGTELIAVVAEAYSDDPKEHSRLALAIREAIAQQTPIIASYVDVTDERWIIKTSSGKTARSANRDKWLRRRNVKS